MDRNTQSLMFRHVACTDERLDVYCLCGECHMVLSESRQWERFVEDVISSFALTSTPSFNVYVSKRRRLASVPFFVVLMTSDAHDKST